MDELETARLLRSICWKLKRKIGELSQDCQMVLENVEISF